MKNDALPPNTESPLNTESSQRTPRGDIAIVGVSALFPGSLDATGFWRDILQGNDLITDVPPSHWLLDDYYDPDPSVPDKTYANRGAFLPDVDFDAMGWGIPPNIIPETDTSQILALIVAQQVLDDAAKGRLGEQPKDRMSVILGVTSGQELLGSMVSRLQRPIWVKALRDSGVPESEVDEICNRISASYTDWNESTFPGLLGNVVAGRIANRLDLGGTNCVTDAACASTFSALSMGINELLLGDSDVVIAGGVDTMNDIFMFMCFSKTPALSKSGDCRPFSDQADGTMLAEGLGMVALKRLEDAERDGDQIYGVIHGLASSSDGRSKSVYAPVSSGQAKALRRAYDQAGYGAETVELMEAHGTGTIAGDAAEFTGLRMAFEESGREDHQWCALGSVKSQIGHAKAAAGAAGLFKAIMAVHHGVLPPTIKVERPNPDLEIETSPFHLCTQSRPWVRDSSHPRRASVSSFGFGGSNFHVALSEYTAEGSGASEASRLRALDSELVAFSASNAADLVKQVREAASGCEERGALHWLAFSSRESFKASDQVRLAVVAADEGDLQSKLDQACDAIESDPQQPFARPDGVHYGVGARVDGEVAFVFSGQGSQALYMGDAAAMHFGEALDVWDRAAEYEWEPNTRLHHVVFPPSAFSEEDLDRQQARLSATEWAQPAIGVTSAAYAALLRGLGLEASVFAGHSFGEITALHAAGVLSEADFFRVARKRGELMRDAASVPGAMTALSEPIERVTDLLTELGSEVVIANHNSPKQVVLSGPTDRIEAAEAKLTELGVSFKRLQVATAFHSPVVAEASDAFGSFLEGVEFGSAGGAVFSNTTATQHSSDAATLKSTVASQLASPVRYVDMIEAMYEKGARTFVEVGPGSIQTGLIGRILGDRPHAAVSLERRGKGGAFPFFDALAALVSQGHDLKLDALWAGYAAPDDPETRHVPKLKIPINGANYGKPYPPAGGAAELPPPNPERPAAASMTSASSAEARDLPMTDRSDPSLSAIAPAVHTAPRVAQTAAAPSAPAGVLPAALSPAALSPAALSPAVQVGGPLAQQMLETQRQTAETHSVYLQMVAQSHTAFLETMGRGLAALQGAPAVPSLGVALPAAPSLAPSPPSPAPVSMPVAQVPNLAVVSAPAPTPTSPAPVAPVAAVSAAPAPAAPSVDVQSLMMEVVAEKTGYPQEMLGLEMELEADLGIDSIKRVEILSEMSAAAPGLPEVDTSVMATLVTVGEVVDYMNGLMGQSGPVEASAPVASASSSASVAAAPSVDVQSLMMEVVAEKTGYPREMLGLEMELEADLGIDSIKRVEILSEMSAAAPGLPEVDTSVMATLVTVGEVVDYMNGLMGSSGASETGEPPASDAPVAAAPSVDVQSLMMEVVAEKTGYPREMLGLEMELEADLGIDSIKRVEILSEMSSAAPGLPEVDTSVMATLVTVGQVVDYMNGLIGGDAGSAGETSAQSADTAATAPTSSTEADAAPAVARPQLGRFALEVVERAPLGMAQNGLLGGGRILVTPEGSDLTAQVLNELNSRGVRAEPAGSQADMAADVSGLIFLGGLCQARSPHEALDVNREAFEAAKAVASRMAHLDGKRGVFVTVQDTGGRFGTSGHGPHQQWLAGLSALTRTVSLEWPEVSAKAIDLERGDRSSDELARVLVDELLAGGPELEVGLGADGTRVALRSVRKDVTKGEPVLKDGDVVVATGGARGVTAATLIALAGTAKLKFALLGRSALANEPACCQGAQTDADLKKALLADTTSKGEKVSPADLGRQVQKILAAREIRATLAAVEAVGSEVSYVVGDVGDHASLQAGLDGVRKRWGKVSAIVHGAGVLADKEIELKTREQFDLVFDTKAVGLWNLLDATSEDDLSALVLFSSVAARCGNVGQSDYAMANEVLNKVALAEARARGGRCVVKSLGWGPWEGGMVTPSLKAHFDAMGVPLIPLKTGAQMLVDELTDGALAEVELVLGGDPVAAALAPNSRPRSSSVDVVVGKGSHAYLRDHAIQGTPVVPVAMVIEWFARAAQAFEPDLQLLSLQEVEVVRGIALSSFEEDDKHLVVRCDHLSNGSGVVASLQLTDSDGTLHYRARAELGEAPAGQPVVTLAGGEMAALEDWGPRAVYSEDGVLFHGPGFQMIQRVEGISDDGIIADLHGVAAAEWSNGDNGRAAAWRTDPVAFDGGLQLALLWGERVLGGATLPTSIERVSFNGPLPAPGRLRARLQGRSAAGSKTVSDVVFEDESGAVVAQFEGVVTHLVPPRQTPSPS